VAVEVIAFSEEEGVRYGVPFIGSRASLDACPRASPLKDAEASQWMLLCAHSSLHPEQIGEGLQVRTRLGLSKSH